MDVRIRAVLLTLFLVVAVASIVRFWPAKTTPVRDALTGEPVSTDDPIRRHFDWAVNQLRTGHYEQAINGFRAVLEQAPVMPEAYVNTGFAQIELQQFEQATQSFQAAIDLRPAQVNAYWGLAVALEGLCDIPGAMGAMRTYVHLAEPDDAYLVKANAALWEWEQLKTGNGSDNPASIDCKQPEQTTQEK